MAQTIKGGAYQNPDGSWVDANGKPLPSSKVEEAQELKKNREAEAKAAVPALVPADVLPPVVSLTGDEKPKRGGRKSS